MLESNPALVHARHPQDETTPLHAAASVSWDTVVAWLIEHGANVNARAKWGATPLEVTGMGHGHSSRDSQTARVRDLLLAAGAERTARFAVAIRDAEWLRARHAEGTLVNQISEIGGLVRAAVVHDRPDMLSLLLELGLDPDERVRAGETELSGIPLRECVRLGKTEMAEILIAGGAELTPQVAVALGKVEWLRRRHAEGALENPIDGEEGGLLTVAVRHDRPDVLALLLSLGFDPGRAHAFEWPGRGRLLMELSAPPCRHHRQAGDGRDAAEARCGPERLRLCSRQPRLARLRCPGPGDDRLARAIWRTPRRGFGRPPRAPRAGKGDARR